VQFETIARGEGLITQHTDKFDVGRGVHAQCVFDTEFERLERLVASRTRNSVVEDDGIHSLLHVFKSHENDQAIK
jgi:hypothetical protein